MKFKTVQSIVLSTLLLSSLGFAGCKKENPTYKNVIIVIGDGMGLEHIEAGELSLGQTFSFNSSSWAKTTANTNSLTAAGSERVTDSAAAATALASGNLTLNKYVGKNIDGKDVETILDYASSLNKSTGIVTTDTLYGATPAGFSAHALNRNDSFTILSTQLESGVDLLCGTTDDKCLALESSAEEKGYTFCTTVEQAKASMASDKVYWQLGLAGATPSVALKDATVDALNYLNQDEDGFVLMVEQAHIDKYSHNNDFDGMIKCAYSINETVKGIIEWLGDSEDTLVLVTADHETGGLSVEKEQLTNRFTPFAAKDQSTFYYKWSKTDHTDSYVGLFIYNKDFNFSKYLLENDKSAIKNATTYQIMKDSLK